MMEETHQKHRHCAGCGVRIQTEDQERAGYVPSSALEREKVICQRCFKITHYSEVTPVELTDDDFLRILHTIGSSKALIVKLVDMFDFNGSWLSGLQRFAGGNNVLLIGNKLDLLPKNVNLNRMKNWLQQSSKELGLKPIDILFCSAEKGTRIGEVLQAIDEYRNDQDVYVVGATNVGKTTFINQILKRFGVDKKDLLTTSRFPGTTLDMIEIPLDDGQALVDTPGIINRHQMAHYVTPKELKIISPSKPIKPKVYQLNDQQTLFFGGLARLDFVSGPRQSFVCYLSNQLPIHRTKLDNADSVYEKHAGDMLSPPEKEQHEQMPKLMKHTFKVDKEPTDIVFSGLGWVTIKGEGARIEAYAPEGVAVLTRRSLI